MPHVEEQGDQAVIRLDALHPVGPVLPFVMEESFGGAMQICRTVMGPDLKPDELRLSYRPPRYASLYSEFFQCPVLFNQECNAMTWGSKALQAASPVHNPASAEMAEAMCRQITADQDREDGLVYEVRYVLLRSPGRFPQAAEVAQRLGTSERSLRRGLGAAGTSFQQLLDEVRAKIATEYLESSELRVEDIALLTGFRDATNFSRAFKRWTGKSPSALR